MSEPVRPKRWLHALAWCVPAFAAVGAIAGLLYPWQLDLRGYPGSLLAPQHGNPVVEGINTAVGVGLIVGSICAWRHSKSLCLECVAHMPLNPDRSAERWRWALRVTHEVSKAALLVVLLLLFATPRGWPLNIGDFLGGTAAAGWLFALAKHSSLQPWCPWCRDGDPGEDEKPPVPQPGRDLPVGTG